MKLTKKVANPRCLSYIICNPAVFSISTRMRQRVLMFRGSRQEVVTKKNTVSRSRSARSQTTCPVSIRVGNKLSKLLLDVNWNPERITIKHLCLLNNPGSIFHVRQEYARGHSRETARLRTVRMVAGCCKVGGGSGGGGVVGGVCVVCGDGVDGGVGGVDCRVVCGFVCEAVHGGVC
nr:hypothetical protein [Tanacetum cinerariifolium]